MLHTTLDPPEDTKNLDVRFCVDSATERLPVPPLRVGREAYGIVEVTHIIADLEGVRDPARDRALDLYIRRSLSLDEMGGSR
jgi:hypothetical protein